MESPQNKGLQSKIPQNEGKIVRFGLFQVNLASAELRKGGIRLRLQGQPFQVLALLLERPGELVTREELKQRLWASDTFVDFDHSLNTAINRVREALGDSAASPRYVETIARRGYRFIVPVQIEDLPAKTAEAEIRSDTPAQAGSPLHPELEIPIPHRGITRGLFVLIQVMYLAFYVSALFRLHAIQTIADFILPWWGAISLLTVVMVTAGIGIPLRCYLISGVSFDYRRMGEKFRRIFPAVFALDQLWAVAPFLLTGKIGPGAAFAVTAALLYVPFSERTLIRMAYASSGQPE